MRNNKMLEYQMNKKMFTDLLNRRTDMEEKENPYNYVIKVINEQFGLKGTVTQLSII